MSLHRSVVTVETPCHARTAPVMDRNTTDGAPSPDERAQVAAMEMDVAAAAVTARAVIVDSARTFSAI